MQADRGVCICQQIGILGLGRAFSIAKRPEDSVYEANVNQLLFILAGAMATDLAMGLSMIVRLVRGPLRQLVLAHSPKTHPQHVDCITSIFAPCAMTLALATFVAWIIRLQKSSSSAQESHVASLMFSICVTVTACTCVLKLPQFRKVARARISRVPARAHWPDKGSL